MTQLQIFHLLKYDCWPRYLRANVGAVEEFSAERGHSIASSSGGGNKAVEHLRQFQVGLSSPSSPSLPGCVPSSVGVPLSRAAD